MTRRERWGLSLYGCAAVAVFILALACLAGATVYPFLAITQRVITPTLVIEGWVNDHAIAVAFDEFRSGAYDGVYTTGGPVFADQLKQAGIAANFLHAAPAPFTAKDRTYHSALALRDLFREHNRPVAGINIVTEGAHARRTRLMYQKAFGDDVAIGVISVNSPGFDQKRWWRYSEGVREVLSESIAYLYARFLFSPEKAEGERL